MAVALRAVTICMDSERYDQSKLGRNGKSGFLFQFIQEFNDVSDEDSDLRLEGVERTPREMIAYQLGWMGLIRGWDSDELPGKEVITPALWYKWNQMGALYEGFYASYSTQSLSELKQMYQEAVSSLLIWLQDFSADELYTEH